MSRIREIILLTVFVLDEAEKRGRQVVAETSKGFCKFSALNRPRSIPIEMAKDVLPVRDILP